MNRDSVNRRLARLLNHAVHLPLNAESRIVVFSDLHLGNGGRKDDFLKNGPLLQYALEHHYEKHGYILVLNGDVEELQRFYLKDIRRQWASLYGVFDRFHRQGRLYKLLGNHDLALELGRKRSAGSYPVHEALKMTLEDQVILVFHGHQSYRYLRTFILLSGFLLRWVANPLGIKNYSVAYNSRKKYTVEKRAYHFARSHRLLTLIGHTHRPLFESLSKLEQLKYRIEAMCRAYTVAPSGKRAGLAERIRQSKTELKALRSDRGGYAQRYTGGLYDSEPLVPCLFNSGCAIGKSGVTALEISDGSIALVHWFDRRNRSKYLNDPELRCHTLSGSAYCRVILKREPLDYVFTRIRLLS